MTTEPPDIDAVRLAVEVKETASLEQRHWVRINYACNNRCCFCLDAKLLVEPIFRTVEEVRADIDAGRAAGASRLILSGGEASIHPDFVALVRYGREVGYERVQTITNGRMFTYRKFFRQAVAAGLGEITFSLHSHRAAVHDRITAVAGAFEQAYRALRRALAEPGLIVSVDVVINRLNVGSLTETVSHYADLGVGEFDLLHLVPFGRAFSDEQRCVPLAVEPGLLRAELERVFALGQRRGLVIWTNRLPAEVLEGYEHLIQDPHKLVDEVRGRHQHMTRLVEKGTALPCRDERCDVCYLQHFCDVLHPLQERVAARELPALRVTLAGGEQPPDLAEFADGLRQLWVVAPTASVALALPAPGVDEIWELGSVDDLEAMAASGALAERRVRRLVVRAPEQIAPALAASIPEVKLLVDRAGWDWVCDHADVLPPGLVLGVRVPTRLSVCLETMIDLTDPRLGALAGRGTRIEDLPPCLGGTLPGDAPGFVDREVIDAAGRLDPDRFVEVYIERRYRMQSQRCAGCVHHEVCPGLHINLIRAQGFSVLSPIE